MALVYAKKIIYEFGGEKCAPGLLYRSKITATYIFTLSHAPSVIMFLSQAVCLSFSAPVCLSFLNKHCLSLPLSRINNVTKCISVFKL